jgi:hypothetical protein
MAAGRILRLGLVLYIFKLLNSYATLQTPVYFHNAFECNAMHKTSFEDIQLQIQSFFILQ